MFLFYWKEPCPLSPWGLQQDRTASATPCPLPEETHSKPFALKEMKTMMAAQAPVPKLWMVKLRHVFNLKSQGGPEGSASSLLSSLEGLWKASSWSGGWSQHLLLKPQACCLGSVFCFSI